MPRPWKTPRGLVRLLSHETNLCDLLQMLSDLDSHPWQGIVGFIPEQVDREVRAVGHADLLLRASDGQVVVIEVKLGHLMSDRQQARYEAEPDSTHLYLAALRADANRVTEDMSCRWTFLSIGDVFARWTNSEQPLARALAHEITAVIRDWDDMVDSVLQPHGAPLERLTAKFPARVVTRRIAAELQSRGRVTLAGVTSGGGLPVVQSWSRIDGTGDEDKCFIAEVRWWDNKVGGELRFGVDYDADNTPATRREAYDLARSMSDVIDADAWERHMSKTLPSLAAALTHAGDGRPRAKGAHSYTWDDVITHGLGSGALRRPDGKRITRLQINPGFHGDGDLRFEALAALDFTRLSAPDVVELLDHTLTYLQQAATRTAWGHQR